MQELEILPEISMSKNSVQEHQLHQELDSAVATSVPRAQDQRESRVAESIKKSVSPQTQGIYRLQIKRIMN
jgi:hypothetical protein